MMESSICYVPCLRWKRGEYQALMRLSLGAKPRIIPLIEVPEIGFDFESQRATKSIDEHLGVVANRVSKKWENRLCFIDTPFVSKDIRMANGQHPTEFLFEDLRKHKCHAIPVTGPHYEKTQVDCTIYAARQDQFGGCYRVAIDYAARPEAVQHAMQLITDSEMPPEIWCLVLDLGAPSFQPIEAFAKLVSVVLARYCDAIRWGNVVLLSTSFPSTMGSVSRGIEIVPRDEWQLYKTVVRELQSKVSTVPLFGDYAINHPDPTFVDMRLVKPAATIRYTIDNGWAIVKGVSVRDNGYLQYRQLCSDLVNSNHFLGEGFSAGDRYIADCARGSAKTGNLTTWRWVGTNHHIEKVVHDVSNFA